MESNPRLPGAELLENLFGAFPSFHDAEILRIELSRVNMEMLFFILLPFRTTDTVSKQDAWRHFEVTLRFVDIEDLELRDFNYQNVIRSLILTSVELERFTTGKVEEGIKVEIDSVFGATCSFTCREGSIIKVSESSLRTGHPF